MGDCWLQLRQAWLDVLAAAEWNTMLQYLPE